MSEIDNKIQYKEELIENIKNVLEKALQETNNIELDDKEISFIIYCNNKDECLGISKSNIGLNTITKLEQSDKYKIVLDKIKELAKENINNGFMRPEIEETTMTFKNALALDILELLEEIE